MPGLLGGTAVYISVLQVMMQPKGNTYNSQIIQSLLDLSHMTR